MTNVSNPYLTVKAVAKKRLATPIALVCAFFGVAVAYSTVELFLRKYGRLPEQLNELVPEFLPAVPVNPFTGNPLQIESGTLEYYRSLTETIETFKGYRIYLDGVPEARPVGLTRTDRYGRIPVWNRAMKLPGG